MSYMEVLCYVWRRIINTNCLSFSLCSLAKVWSINSIHNFFCKCFTNLCIGCGIYGTCTVIKNQNLWLFKKGSCNTKTLLLPTRNIRTTLFDICMITIWHSVNKFIRTGKMAGPLTLFLCCILITPAEVIENCTGEKNIFL